MDSRIDLTANDDFSSRTEFDSILRLFLANKPWDIKSAFKDLDELDNRELGIFHIGNKENRILKRLTEDCISRLFCDRCGKPLFQWNFNSGLCNECNQSLIIELNPKPWIDNYYYSGMDIAGIPDADKINMIL